MELHGMVSNYVQNSWKCIPFSVASLILSSENPKWQDHQNNAQKDAVDGILLRQKWEAVFKSCYSYQCPNYSAVISLGNYLKHCLNWKKVIFTEFLEMALSDLKIHGYHWYCSSLILIVREWIHLTNGTDRVYTNTILLLPSPRSLLWTLPIQIPFVELVFPLPLRRDHIIYSYIQFSFGLSNLFF